MLLLRAFELLQGQRFQLLILGKGGLEAQILEAAKRDARISFKGYCTQSEAKSLECGATVLINPRPSRQAFTQYSFPSKILEYMATGRPVISTRLPGIPEEYFAHMIVLENETPEELAALFLRLEALPRAVLDELGANARTFVSVKKNERSQGQRILAFLERLGIES